MIDLWNQLAERASVALSQSQHALLSRYLDLLLEANETMNLTRIDDRAQAEVGHVGDALTLLPHLPQGPHRLADVGSGGGVPGIPLAIARPDATVTLIESTQKKAAFLTRTADALGLANVRTRAERAETAARTSLRDSFDVVVARAVGPMDVLAELCLPLVKPGGRLLAMKGARIVDELPAAQRAIHQLSGGGAVVHRVQLPGTDSHVIVEVRKKGRTDDRYPPSAQPVEEAASVIPDQVPPAPKGKVRTTAYVYDAGRQGGVTRRGFDRNHTAASLARPLWW